MRRIALAALLTALSGAAWPARAADRAVTISGFAFSPATVTVSQGDSVTWTMADPPPTNHTVTSDDGHSFSSSYLATGETFAHTFNAPGTFPYHCAIHSNMRGTVVVTSSAASTTSTSTTTTTARPTTTTTARPTTTTTARPTTTTASTASTTTTTVAALATTTTSEESTTTSTSEAAAPASKRGGSNNGPKVVALLLAIAGLGAGAFAVARRLRAAP